jgi:monofunctional biosynthetic peptidoglycan transglycosylase
VWEKQRILEVYLNVIETGPGCFGVEAAAQHFFHKSAKNLTREQAAMIVAGFPNQKNLRPFL